MVVGDDVAAGVKNDAGTAAALDQHPPVEHVADIGLVGDADHRGTHDLGRAHDRRISGRRQRRTGGLRLLYFLIELRDGFRQRLAQEERAIAKNQAAANDRAKHGDNKYRGKFSQDKSHFRSSHLKCCLGFAITGKN